MQKLVYMSWCCDKQGISVINIAVTMWLSATGRHPQQYILAGRLRCCCIIYDIS